MKNGSLTFLCLTIFFFSSIVNTYAQFDSLGLNTKWRPGSIILTDNSSLEGLIQFNDKLGMIKFKESAGSTEESFSERSIITMRFYDEDVARWRSFASFNLKDDQSGWQGALLFEVLMEFNSFALLTRIERVNIAARQRTNYYGDSYNQKVGYEQFEKFCLADEEGVITVVLAVNEFERDKLALGASKLKAYLNKQALEKYLADDWDKFQDLVKSNKLNLKKKADFIRAFEYFQLATQK